MVRVLSRLFGKWFPKRRKPKSTASVTPQPTASPPVNEDEVRKRLEGLGYIE